MNKKVYSIFGGIAIIIASLLLINSLYLYDPFNFPKGNLSIWGYSWIDFENPIDIEVLSWYEGERVIYVPQQNNKNESRYIINSFANLKKIEDYSYNEYIDNLPQNRGKEYRVFVRRSDIKNEYGMAIGNILLPFSFYETSEIAQVDGTIFFEITEELKNHIIETYSEELEIQN